MNAHDRHAEIEASRSGPAVVRSVSLAFHCPRTERGNVYPQTLTVRVPAGQMPAWLVPFFVRHPKESSAQLRRIEQPGESLGFITGSYTDNAAAPGVYVTRQPADGTLLMRALVKAATDAGWGADAWGGTPLFQTELYAPR